MHKWKFSSIFKITMMPCAKKLNCSVFQTSQRFHFTCLTCRHRLFFYGKLDTKKYINKPELHMVLPIQSRFFMCILHDGRMYFLVIDKNRQHRILKDIVLNAILKLVTNILNEKKNNLFVLKRLIVKKLCTVGEFLAV